MKDLKSAEIEVDGYHCSLDDGELELLKSYGATVEIKGYNRHVYGTMTVPLTEIETVAVPGFKLEYVYGSWYLKQI